MDALWPLQNVYKNEFRDPIRVYISRWDKDKYARGMGCYCAKGSSTLDIDYIDTPEKTGLFFAGKHTEKKLCDCSLTSIQGAYESGIRAALEIDAFLKNKKQLTRVARSRFH